jgi:hypothetical protein
MCRMRWMLAALLGMCLVIAPVSVVTHSVVATEIPVDVLVYFEYAEGSDGAMEPGGGVIPTIVGVTPNDTNRIRVGFFEGVSLGSGTMWRTAGWMAAIVGAYTLRADLDDYTIYFDVDGRIDGPSAGALMTCAVLAGMQGHKILPHATMTGTINPDGTIGPVGGISYKIAGAAANGKTLVLIPVGQRFEQVSETEVVDLVAHGAQYGVTVREVGDIYEAYTILTGERIERPVASVYGQELPHQSFSILQRIYESWLGEYTRLDAEMRSLGSAFSEEVTKEVTRARQALMQGLVAVAYDRITTAVATARMEYLWALVSTHIRQGRLDLSNALLAQKAAVAERIDAYLAELNTVEPASLGDVPGLMSAYSAGIQAYGCYLLGDARELSYRAALDEIARSSGLQLGATLQSLDGYAGALVVDVMSGGAAAQAGIRSGDVIVQISKLPVQSAEHLGEVLASSNPGLYYLLVWRAPNYTQQEWVLADLAAGQSLELSDTMISDLLDALVFYEFADLMLETGADHLAVGQYPSKLPAPRPDKVEQLGRLLRAGAHAGLEYFDANVLDSVAQAYGVHLETFRWQFMNADYGYAATYASMLADLELGEISPYALLGSAATLFYETGSLIVKYYNLDAQIDETGSVVAVSNEKALIHMLNLAMNQASTAIEEARAVGVEPVLSLMSLEIAQYLREQTLDDKLTALNLLWNASCLARTLVMLVNAGE